MCDLLIPALIGLGVVALASGGGGECCDNACYSPCSTCGTASYGAAYNNGGYGYTPTYAPSPNASPGYAPAPPPASGAKRYTPTASYQYNGYSNYAGYGSGYGYGSNYYGGNYGAVTYNASGGRM